MTAKTLDLTFIATHVKAWPKGAHSVRLDRDGEVCFEGAEEYDEGADDFYPDGVALPTEADHPYFVPHYKGANTGKDYSLAEWMEATGREVP